MKIIIFLIGISLVVAVGFLLSFFWAVKTGQYEDDHTPAIRMLFDDELIEQEPPLTNKTKTPYESSRTI